MPVRIIWHPSSLDHDPGPGHPESRDRLAGILEELRGPAYSQIVDWSEAAPAEASPDMFLLPSGRPEPFFPERVTGGKPVYGIPDTFGAVLGYGIAGGVPIPVWITIGLILLMYIFINRTRMGRYLYAIGGNRNAAVVSGVSTRFYLFMAYVVTAALTSAAARPMIAKY